MTSLRFAWLVVGLLFPVALLNYLDRQMIASMQKSIMRDLPDIQTDERWGIMLAQFKWVYAFCSPFGGWVADRFGRRITVCSSLAVWSVITWYTGHAQTYEQLLWTRTAMGISEAFYIPAALALIADYHTGNTRSRAVGVHQMGIYCGVIAGGFTGILADEPSMGWRWVFDVTGIAGVLYAIPLFILLKDVPRPADAISGSSLSSTRSSFLDLLGNKAFLLLVACFTLPAIAGWVVRDWMPKILQVSFNISQGKAGVSASLYWQSAAILSALVGGWLADKWMQKTERGRIFTSASGLCLLVPALFLEGNAPAANSFGMAIAGLILFGIGWGWFDCNNMPILCQITKPSQRATAYGFMNLVSMLAGGKIDVFFGWLQDQKVPLNQTFGVFAACSLLAAVLMLLIRPNPALVEENKAENLPG